MQTAQNYRIFYLFLFSEKVDQSWKVLDEGSPDSEAFIIVEVKILFSKSILLKEINRKVMSGIVEEK